MKKLILSLSVLFSFTTFAADAIDNALEGEPNIAIREDGANVNAPNTPGCPECGNILRSSRVGYLNSTLDIARSGTSSAPVTPGTTTTPVNTDN